MSNEPSAAEKLAALQGQGNNQADVHRIETTGHVGAIAITTVATATAINSGTFMAFAGRTLAPLGAALLGGWIAQKIGAAEAVMPIAEMFGAKRQAAPGKAVACVTHKIAHNHAFHALIGMLVVGLVVAAAVALTVATGGLAAAAVAGAAFSAGGIAAAFGMGFIGGVIAGVGALMADVTGKIATGSPNVFVEDQAVARVSDTVLCDRHSPPPQIIEGSQTIFVNDLPLVRIGHRIKCNAVVQEGAKTVFGDLTTQSFGEPDAEFSIGQQAILSLAEVIGIGASMRKAGLPPNAKRCLNGEPIDIVTGDYADYRTDFHYPGTLPLTLTRTYPGKMQVEGLLGTRWICNWSQRLVYDDAEGTLVFEDAEGQRLVFPADTELFKAYHLKAAYYRLSGHRREARITDTRTNQTLIFGCPEGGNIGRLDAIEDNNGNRITFYYRARTRLQQQQQLYFLDEILHSDGTCFRVTVTDSGQIASVIKVGDFIPVVSYQYDEQDRLQDVIARFAGNFHYSYTTEGLLQSWRDDGVTQVTLDYDVEGRVIATTTPQGLFNDRFEYYPDERKSRYIDATGACSTFWYNADHLVVKESDPLGNVSHTVWDCYECKVSYTDVLGRTTRYQYDSQARLINTLYHNNRTRKQRWNEQGQVTELQLPNGDCHQWHYDQRGNCIAWISADGISTTYRYDQRGCLIEQRRANELQGRWDYTASGKLIGYLDAAYAHTEIEQDSYRRITAITNALGKRTDYDYTDSPHNPRGALAKVTTPDGGIRRWHYDSEGQIATFFGAQGQTSHYQHGAFDLLSNITDNNGHQTRFAYDKVARLTRVTNAIAQEWRYTYDPAGRLIKETDWAGRQTHYLRDALGRLQTKKLQDGSQQIFIWDDIDRLTEVVSKGVGEVTRQCYVYDERDRLASAIHYRNDQQESEICYVYDELGQLIEERQNGIILTYAYDALGRCIRRSTPSGTTEYDFDVRGALEAIHSNGHTLQMKRDLLGQEILRQHAWQDTKQEQARQPYQPLVRNAFTLQQEYDPCGRLKMQRAGAHMPQLQATQQSTNDGALSTSPQPFIHPGNLDERQYSWDTSGRLKAIDDNRRGARRYHYDQRDQIVEIDKPLQNNHAATTERYLYDKLGNLQNQGVELDQFYSFHAGCVTKAGNTDYRWDKLGRLITRKVTVNGFRPQSWNYNWNSQGRLIQCRTPEGDIWQYAYDVFGRRISKRCAHRAMRGRRKTICSIRYVWDGAVIAEEWRSYADGSSEQPISLQPSHRQASDIQRWLYAPGSFMPLAKEYASAANDDAPEAANESRFFPIVTDHLGTPKEMYTAEGECVWSANHTLWGECKVTRQGYVKPQNELQEYINPEEQKVDCDLRFANQWEDEESGLYYNLHRYYDPHSGQYASIDPIGLMGGLRTHGYVENPTTWVDPLGLASCPEKFIRYVSEEEALAMKKAGGLVPKMQNGKLSRGAKWISEAGKGRNPKALGEGAGRPTHVVEISAKPGTKSWLNDPANTVNYDDMIGGESDNTGNILLKDNEPGSYGVGKDLIGDFNSRVTNVSIKKL